MHLLYEGTGIDCHKLWSIIYGSEILIMHVWFNFIIDYIRKLPLVTCQTKSLDEIL